MGEVGVEWSGEVGYEWKAKGHRVEMGERICMHGDSP